MTQKENLKPISEDQNLLKLVLSSEAVEDLNLLKDRLAHKFPNASYSEIVEFLIREKLQALEAKMQIKEDKSTFTIAAAVEVDHVTSVARNGTNELSGLRLLCRSHNAYFAKEIFSSEWMEQFLPRLRREE